MRILLDTHTLLWALTEKSRLSSKVRSLLPSAETWFSVAGIWEIVTKVQVGKLSLPRPAGAFVKSELSSNGVQVLGITLDHVLRLESLDLHHRDPFDRILIAQSLEEKLPIVTSDPLFALYPVEVIW
jgi:PIN domain nuclease of toxin-antitoxin system